MPVDEKKAAQSRSTIPPPDADAPLAANSTAGTDVDMRGRPRHVDESRVAQQPEPDPILALRVVVEHVRPQIDHGRFAAKTTVGEAVHVLADIFADGHDVIAAVLLDRPGQGEDPGRAWRETPMALVAPGTDEWGARFTAEAPGWHEFAVIAWVDPFATWRKGLKAKWEAAQDVGLELVEGGLLVREAAGRAAQIGMTSGDAEWLEEKAEALCGAAPIEERVAVAHLRRPQARDASPACAHLGGSAACTRGRMVRDVSAFGRTRSDAQRHIPRSRIAPRRHR